MRSSFQLVATLTDKITARFCAKRAIDDPSCSPDLNPVDYAIWGLLMQRLGRKKYRSLQELKAALRRAGESIRVEELRNIIGQFKKRLEACVIAKGGNFEHLLH